MADKQAIELGLRLYRLMDNEDFQPLLQEWDKRIDNHKAQLRASSSVYDCPPHITSHISQRLEELVSLREWIDDEIESGGREKMKQEVLDAHEAVA